MSRLKHTEKHRTEHIGWLRAAVLGANDGLVSTASLIVGVASAGSDPKAVLVAGVAGMVAGAASMAAGEYVSVKSQAETEAADTARETAELRDQPDEELEELTQIYQQRGLDRALAEQVAAQLMQHNALEAHLRDELGITEALKARPVQAAMASAVAFAVGALLPILVVLLAPAASVVWAVGAATVVFLAVLGGLAAHTGGAPVLAGTLRVTFWGVLALVLTSVVGRLFGVSA